MTTSRRWFAAALAVAVVTTVAAAASPLPRSTAAAPASSDRRSTPTAELRELVDGAVDVRASLPALAPTAAQRSAAARLDGARITWNRTLGTPRMVTHPAGALSAPASGDPVRIARGWLAGQRELFGLDGAGVAALEVVRDHELPGIGASVVSFVQAFGGVPAGHGGVLTVVVDRAGRVVCYSGNPVRNTGLAGAFELSPAQAIGRVVEAVAPDADFAVEALGREQGGYDVYAKGPFLDVVRVRKVAFPMPSGARPAYAVLLVKSVDEAWATIVDAATGRTLLRKSLVQHAEGTVYENHPGAARGGRPVVRSFGPTPQSPGGWADPTGLVGTGATTLGDNADTTAAWTLPVVPVDQVVRPVSPTGELHYRFTDSWRRSRGAPGSYIADAEAATVNLFFHHNRIHDEFYEFGFTETGGNFELSNGARGGLGGDPILGGAQSGASGVTDPVLGLGRNNANMLTLPDGIPGITNMYLWAPVDDVFEGGYRDGDFDSTIIHHEYAHGLSNRYVGGGGLGSLGVVQSGAMGEGWGDWFAMNHLFRAGLTRTAVTAPYVGDPQRGIRNWNYDRNPLTYGDYGYDMSGPQVHSDGELWAATLWSLRTAVLRAVGGRQARASDVSEHLVMDAMPISPPEPSFLDMRDAIIKASELRYGDRFTDLLWSVFARRGMGLSARTLGETDTDPRPGFDHPRARRNGRLVLRLVNASAGGPVSDARVLGGRFEARATPIFTTSRRGLGSARMMAGHYRLTVQAPGYGIQQVAVRVRAGGVTRETVALEPNLLSEASGARVVHVTSQHPGLPATGLLDDSEATAWGTAGQRRAYVDGPRHSVTVRLGRRSVVSRVAVSVVKPVGQSRFSAADRVLVQTSTDGRRWRTARVASFSFTGPRPTVGDLALRTHRLRQPVRARFVRVVAASTFGDSAATPAARVAEVQAFGPTGGIRPRPPRPDPPVTSRGRVAAGNLAQGSLLGVDPYRPGATELSWPAACPGPPPANGADAWMTRLPAGAADGRHVITYRGSVPVGEWLLWWYDGDCQPMTGDFGYVGEPTPIPAGAAYAGFLLLYGGGASFDVTVSEPR